MATDREIHSALVRWLAAITGDMFVKGEQSGDLPALPYGMVNMTGTAEVRKHPQEIEYVRHPDIAGESQRTTASPVIEVEWRFSVHAYGDHPTDTLRPIRSAFHLAQANEPLLPNLVIFEISQIRDLPEFLNNTWEPRAQMDVMLRGLTRDGILIDTIEEYTIGIYRA